ncbi:MAG: alpha/beta fold hydrolase [Rhizobiaceae bacterium]|nr:alpha/beta fold hydrolase [Rhizobiaceae bacterium]
MIDAQCTLETVQLVGSEGNQLAASVYRSDNDGSNPVILMMHGGGQTRHSWDGAARQLAVRGNTVVTVDARGHGDSEWVTSENYRFQDHRDDLRCIAGQVSKQFCAGNRAPVVVGASMGGLSALLTQADEKIGTAPLFSAIVLVDITPRMQASGVDKILGFMSKDMRHGFANIDEAGEAIATYLPNRARPRSLDGLAKNLRQKSDGRWYWHWDPAFVDGDNNIMTGRSNRHEVLLDAAKQITVPTLLVRGGKSELVTQEAATEFLQHVPHAKYVDVTDAGHMVAGDRNDVFAQAVIEFLVGQGLA